MMHRCRRWQNAQGQLRPASDADTCLGGGPLRSPLVEALAAFPEPTRSFALRRAVEEVKVRVKGSAAAIVDCKTLLATSKVTISHSTFNAIRRMLLKKKLLRREDLNDA